jgi:multiple sugar transport system substrate-binding protein
MRHDEVSRRRFLTGLGGVGAAAVLGGCATGSSSSGGGSKNLVLQSSLSDAAPKAALAKVVQGYTNNKITLNTIASESFRPT